jgi:hypothetical protein
MVSDRKPARCHTSAELERASSLFSQRVNGHEWAKRQCGKAGIGYRELSNGFAACDDPAALQKICDALRPATIEAFAQR